MVSGGYRGIRDKLLQRVRCTTLETVWRHMEDTTVFAELEQREWSEPAVAGAYASEFAKASDMVAPHLVAAVGAGLDTEVLDLCCGPDLVGTVSNAGDYGDNLL